VKNEMAPCYGSRCTVHRTVAKQLEIHGKKRTRNRNR